MYRASHRIFLSRLSLHDARGAWSHLTTAQKAPLTDPIYTSTHCSSAFDSHSGTAESTWSQISRPKSSIRAPFLYATPFCPLKTLHDGPCTERVGADDTFIVIMTKIVVPVGSSVSHADHYNENASRVFRVRQSSRVNLQLLQGNSVIDHPQAFLFPESRVGPNNLRC